MLQDVECFTQYFLTSVSQAQLSDMLVSEKRPFQAGSSAMKTNAQDVNRAWKQWGRSLPCCDENKKDPLDGRRASGQPKGPL